MLHFYVNVLSIHSTVSVAENGTCICICSMLSKLMKFNGMFNRHSFDRKEWYHHWLSVLFTHMNDVTYITFQYIITMFSPEYYCYTVLYYTILKIAYKPLVRSLICLNIHIDVFLIPPIIVHTGSVIGLHMEGTCSSSRTIWLIISEHGGHNTFFLLTHNQFAVNIFFPFFSLRWHIFKKKKKKKVWRKSRTTKAAT